MKILGIETSCDETSVAIVDASKHIHAQRIWSQIKEHAPYGGVVPEIAARAHMDRLDRLIKETLNAANIDDIRSLDAIAVTAGPGLIGGVIVGVMMAKAMASAAKIPCLAMNHLEGHALSARLAEDVPFPFLLLLVSGGHCMFLSVEGLGAYQLLGQTLDDALGEAFDKVAKMMGLGYPGGPIIEQLAKKGNPHRFNIPRSLKGRKGCDFSFSGIKTAISRMIASQDTWNKQDQSDMAASFQLAAKEIIQDRLDHALCKFQAMHPSANRLVVAGGVAANEALRSAITNKAHEYQCTTHIPPKELCTDNAAMIAWAGVEYFLAGVRHSLDFVPRARWPLSEMQHIEKSETIS